ncbi:hypothetical protein GSY71_18255 [Pusillimonas sp. TS35]|nr:hypothetical protein [Pusillimonas sp. TS35]
MTTSSEIEKLTDVFFERHWSTHLGPERPTWKFGWNWQGSVPYHNKGGVYALMDGAGHVVYIGLGASLGGGGYKGYGISNRLLGHVLTRDRPQDKEAYLPRTRWSEVASIGAIGFPLEFNYLAPALEDYLIRATNPPKKKQKNKLTKTATPFTENELID